MTKEKPTKPNKNRPDGDDKTDKTSKNSPARVAQAKTSSCAKLPNSAPQRTGEQPEHSQNTAASTSGKTSMKKPDGAESHHSNTQTGQLDTILKAIQKIDKKVDQNCKAINAVKKQQNDMQEQDVQDAWANPDGDWYRQSLDYNEDDDYYDEHEDYYDEEDVSGTSYSQPPAKKRRSNDHVDVADIPDTQQDDNNAAEDGSEATSSARTNTNSRFTEALNKYLKQDEKLGDPLQNADIAKLAETRFK